MGVPKFFRYISERYPCLSEIVKEYQIPEFDNLYLDMNGIIHTCSHPDDNDPHFRISEEKIFEDIFHYIEVLFRMIKPQKLFFMAVDGVAPRAKMNQQRGRRFNSAKDAQKLEEAAKRKGEILPEEARFDSNCITPGTPFMARLHEQLKYFVVNKISTDRLWSKCKIILSGHETPGEGEHKIMDYIRYLRAQPGYDPNTRHCLYGLDADLIMLGLCTHDPHFSLLREEVKFGKKSTKRKNVPEEITFYLLHLSLMREYLELEFQELKDCISFTFDIEKIIDDWVLMGFLVGNDFIPNLPNLHIANGALPILYSTYIKVLPSLGGYINEAGALNLSRFEKFMEALSQIDMEHFQETYADLKYFEAKTGRRPNEKERTSYKPIEITETDNKETLPETEIVEPSVENLENLALEPDGFEVFVEEECDPEDIDTDDDDDEEFSSCGFMNEEFRLHKRDYYMNKLEYEQVTPEVLRDQAEGYVKAIQWNLNYYYNGCCSWSWYYPHHYAPYISDIKGFSDLKIEFELGQPFKPFEQLLGVLPAASKELLPKCYQELMTSEDSPLKKYYPEDFSKDLNGKKQDWEAVVLIPFIDQKLLLNVMEPLNEKLTDEEKKRNSHGPMLVYNYTEENLGKYTAPSYFPPINDNHAHCVTLSIDDIKVPIEKLVKGAYPGVMLDVYYPGFPTFKHLTYTGSLQKAKVRVFEQSSKGENMIITIKPQEQEPDFIRKTIGHIVHVGWPHLVEAKVVAISTQEGRYVSVNNPGEYNFEEIKRKEGGVIDFDSELSGVVEHYRSRYGILVGKTDFFVHVQVITGRKYIFTHHGRATLEKQFSNIQAHYPLQTVVKNISVHDQFHTTYQDITTIFPPGSKCFMLGNPHYGALGEVLDDQDCFQKGRVKIQSTAGEEPNLAIIKQLENSENSKYMTLFVACSKLSISRYVFSRITGTVFVVPRGKAADERSSQKINVGLNLKFNVKNEETPGFTRKVDNNWLYSGKTVDLIREYAEFCPRIFEYLSFNQKADSIPLEDLFPEDSEENLKKLVTWLKSKPHYRAERQTSGNLIMDPDIVKKLEEVVEAYINKEPQSSKRVVMRVKPQFLFRSDLHIGRLPPDEKATYELCDRIVNIREGYSVPLGAKGTIIGIRHVNENDKMYDIVFDKPFAGGFALNCSNGRGYRLPPAAMINISYGNRVYQEKTGVPGKLIQAVKTPQQNFMKHPVNNNDYNHSIREYNPRQPQCSAFAPWNNIPPRMPVYPVFNVRAGFTGPPPPPTANLSYNQPYMGQPLLKTVILKHDSPKNQNPPSYIIKQKPLEGEENVKRNVPIVPPFAPMQSSNAKANMTFKSNEASSLKQFNPLGAKGTSEETRAAPKPASSDNTTDLLKKMLKINEDHNKTIPIIGGSQTHQPGRAISVNEVFAKAKNNKMSLEQMQGQSDCVKLVSYFQSHNLGCPQYQYFTTEMGMTIAQVSVAGANVFMGRPCRNKEEASQSAAREALKYLSRAPAVTAGTNVNHVKPKSPKTFPTPPRQWYSKKPLVEQPVKEAAKEQGEPSQRDTRLFVPLQAVRGSALTNRSPGKKNVIKRSDINTVENPVTKEKQNEKEQNNPPQTHRKRRERKVRIAANFSKINEEHNS